MENGHEFQLKLEIAAKKLRQQREFLNDYLLLNIFESTEHSYPHTSSVFKCSSSLNPTCFQ